MVVAAGLRRVLWAPAGIAALALAAVGVWWTQAHTGATTVTSAAARRAVP